MTEFKNAIYDDADLKKVIDEIEGFEDEKRSIMAEAAGKCSGIAKRIANAKKVAKSLGIPKASLNALLKVRKLEQKIIDVTGDVPPAEVEIFEDMTSGQFSFLAPESGAESPAHVAARQHKQAAQANEEAEQAAGAEILDGLVH